MTNQAQRDHGRMLREVVAYGRRDLGMSDAEMARELCLSRERIRQLRGPCGALAARKACRNCGGPRKFNGRDFCAACFAKTPEGKARAASAVRKHYDRRAREALRPLLEQCLVVADEHGDNALSADLRRELGLPED